MGLRHALAVRVGQIGWMPQFLPVIVRADQSIEKISGRRLSLLDIAGLPNLRLRVRGRSSGILRETPLLCAPTDFGWYIAGSKFGGENNPAWVYNLRATDTCEVTVGRSTYPVRVVETAGSDRDRGWATLLAVWPNFRLYEERTDRTIPVFALHRG